MSDSALSNRNAAEPVWVFGRPSHLPAKFGRYVLERVLGEGGMGAVYLAHDAQLDRRVALKLPDLSNADRPQVERFLREAKVAATLHHPHLCPVYDAGEIDGHYFLTMPVLEGRPLSAFLGKPMPQRSAIQIARKIAKALQSAHQSGIVHRDLKPSNVMMTGADHLMVMDFGLAKRSDNVQDVNLTRVGHVVGTPTYMAPEQVRGTPDQIGPRTDVYALGAMLFEMLAGRPPFQGSFTGLVVQIAHEPPPLLTDLVPDADPALAEVVAIALAKRPGERYATMGAFANALKNVLANKPGSADEPLFPLSGKLPNIGSSETRSLRPASPTPASGVAALDDVDVVEDVEVVSRPKSKPIRRQFRRRRDVDLEWFKTFLTKVGLAVATLLILFFGGKLGLDFIESNNVSSSLKVLREQPTDAKALERVRQYAEGTSTLDRPLNRDAGLYLCSVEDWNRAFRLLDRCDDGDYREVARRELMGPQSIDDMLSCGDRWYDLSKRETGAIQKGMVVRMRYWYHRLDGMLSGQQLERVTARMAETATP